MAEQTGVEWSHLSRAALDFQLSPSKSAKDAMGVLARHEAETAGLTKDHADLRYGPAAAQLLDVVLPEGAGPHPCVIVIHGGFWQLGHKGWSGFASRALAQAGIATALVGYTLAPETCLSGIVAQIAEAVGYLHENAVELGLRQDRLIVAGHSAGGHMAAAMMAGIGGQAGHLAGAVLISGIYDLAPIAASYVNDVVGLTPQEVLALSLQGKPPAADVPTHIVVGADEPAAFIAQSDLIHARWRGALRDLSYVRAPGRDHFDVLDELADPASPTFARVQEMAG